MRKLIRLCSGLLALLLAGTVINTLANAAGGPIYLPLLHQALAGRPCPAWVHDRHVAIGPDNNRYPTWHAPIDDDTGCFFDHEHGDDPRTSKADATLPAFGYIGAAAGMDEPHNGFKVFVVNQGDYDQLTGETALVHSRIVAHMGTGGPKRFVTRHHSLEYDLVAPNGYFMHVQGMADTGLAGSICDRDASLRDEDRANDIGRSVMTLPDAACPRDSLYEIWTFRLTLGEQAEANIATAVFDPMTVMDPADRERLIRTESVYTFEPFNRSVLSGCEREGYHGPLYWRNATGSEVYYTDAYGAPNGFLRQRVSRHTAIGTAMSLPSRRTQGKWTSVHCAPGLKLPN
jgi:hypothetical protein